MRESSKKDSHFDMCVSRGVKSTLKNKIKKLLIPSSIRANKKKRSSAVRDVYSTPMRRKTPTYIKKMSAKAIIIRRVILLITIALSFPLRSENFSSSGFMISPQKVHLIK